MYLLNGESKHYIDLSDRGLQYGDGLFETIEVINGKPVFLTQHLQRLSKGCVRLKIPFPDVKVLTQEAKQLALCHPSNSAVLKLIVTRGTGGRGYRQPEKIESTRLFSIHPFPDYPEALKQQGVSVRFCQTRLGLNPYLAGIKHLNRLEQVMARSEWQTTDIYEGIMQDIDGNVVEGTMTNVFYVKDKEIFTPSIEKCGVEGVLKNILIALAKQAQIIVIEKSISKDELLAADTVFLTNSIIGIWPVKKIETQQFEIDPVIYQLQDFLSVFKQGEINDG